MYSDLVEQLTANFYNWEKRGRGWMVWDYPVDLEPPFTPFFHYSPNASTQYDDGKKHTLLSSLAENVKNAFTNSNSLIIPNVGSDENNLLEPILFQCKFKIRELKVDLPNNYVVNYDFAKQFLLALSSCNWPISFEIVGINGSIVIQLSCREPDFIFIKKQVQAFFPELIVSEGSNSLDALVYNNSEILIVDFGLSEEFMCPIKTYRSFNPDPLIGAFAALESLSKDEKGIIQILFQPAYFPWAESITRSVVSYDGSSFFMDAPEMVSLSRMKISHPLFAVNLRIACQSQSVQRSVSLIKSLTGFLDSFVDPRSNGFIPLSNDSYGLDLHVLDLINRETHRSGMLLNLEELVSFLHLPSNSIKSNRLRRITRKTKAAPDIVRGHNFILGENYHDNVSASVSLSHEQRLKHTHIIGATGTGKSTLLLNMIAQEIKMNTGICVFDPHGDLIERVLEIIPESRFEDTIVFDPSNESFQIGFNILEARTDVEKNVLSSDLISIFKRFSTTWGDQMTTVLGNSISAFLENKEGGTLLSLRQFLIDEEYRSDYLKNISDPFIKTFWEKEFPLLRGATLSSLLSRLDILLRPKIIRNILGQQSGLDVEDVINTNKILLVKLPQGIIGIENAYLLGSLLFSKIHQVVLRRQLKTTSERKPFYLYIDEFQHFITPSMNAVLSGARKYSLGLILAHQDLQQLFNQDSTLANSVISNPYTRVCFRVGDFDAQKLQGGFSSFDAKDLQNLGIGEAIIRVERGDNDFNLKTYQSPKISSASQKNVERIIEFSRKKFGRSKQEIDYQQFKNIITESISPITSPKKDIPEEFQRELFSVTEEPQEKLSQHRYLQSLIKQIAEMNGYRAVIEQETPDKSGRIDVGLEKDGEKIACEISITTSPEHEFRNIEKCLREGYKKILMCSPNSKQLSVIGEIINERIDPGEHRSIYLFQPDELFDYFNEERLANINKENLIKGYRVKVKYHNTNNSETKFKKETFTKIILSSLHTLKK